jgi:hypothetical protein
MAVVYAPMQPVLPKDLSVELDAARLQASGKANYGLGGGPRDEANYGWRNTAPPSKGKAGVSSQSDASVNRTVLLPKDSERNGTGMTKSARKSKLSSKRQSNSKYVRAKELTPDKSTSQVAAQSQPKPDKKKEIVQKPKPNRISDTNKDPFESLR